MIRFARYILGGLVLTILVGGCITDPKDKLFNLVVFNDGQDDVRVQITPTDVKGQDGQYLLSAGEAGHVMFNIKKYPHTLVFTHIYTGQELRRVSVEPNSILDDRSHNGFDHLDCYYVYGTGEYQNATVPYDSNDR